MIKHVAVPALMVAALCFTSTPAWSDKGHKGKDEKCDAAELVKDAKVTIDQAIKTDKTVWEVEILGADGKMTEVHIDAGTGTIIDKEAKQEKHEKKGKKEKH